MPEGLRFRSERRGSQRDTPGVRSENVMAVVGPTGSEGARSLPPCRSLPDAGWVRPSESPETRGGPGGERRGSGSTSDPRTDILGLSRSRSPVSPSTTPETGTSFSFSSARARGPLGTP